MTSNTTDDSGAREKGQGELKPIANVDGSMIMNSDGRSSWGLQCEASALLLETEGGTMETWSNTSRASDG